MAEREQAAAIVAELYRDPVLVKALRVCAELTSDEDLSALESEAFERHIEGLRLTWCPYCYRAVIAWMDGFYHDWPEREVHRCAALMPTAPAAEEFE